MSYRSLVEKDRDFKIKEKVILNIDKKFLNVTAFFFLILLLILKKRDSLFWGPC